MHQASGKQTNKQTSKPKDEMVKKPKIGKQENKSRDEKQKKAPKSVVVVAISSHSSSSGSTLTRISSSRPSKKVPTSLPMPTGSVLSK